MERILFDCWYYNHFKGNAYSFEDYLKENHSEFVIQLSKRSKWIRGFLLFMAGRKCRLIVTYLASSGTPVLAILEAIFRKRQHLVLLEFIQTKPENKILKLIWPLWRKYIYGPSLRYSLARAQVLTLAEIDTYSALFGIPKERFSFIPWPLHFDQRRLNKSSTTATSISRDENGVAQNYVMASGRANVDWETIFKVAENSDWPLLVVCTSKHLERVSKLNKQGRATVLHDIPQEEHDAYVKGATVYALCLEETFTSVGQVRLMNTIEQGVPVVATKVSGLEGYAINGVNSILVPPGDVLSIKSSIDKLFSAPDLRARLVQSAQNHMQDRTFTNYINQISKTVNNLIYT
ncbi:glycosyltransferase [Pontibacter anaerobius]|uniref:Glycosyltransferase n=1 Tax=Pontibacter anaerobius TaxID=2993940 RepID=A0ABT3RK76_9BACT|nr:glycosyltransferase [Pontibacter anaerobius]MCX2742205.1 glycosyltransferase [Pontibacter anaerobius]